MEAPKDELLALIDIYMVLCRVACRRPENNETWTSRDYRREIAHLADSTNDAFEGEVRPVASGAWSFACCVFFFILS